MKTQEFFVTCPQGLAPLLYEELQQLGVNRLKATETGVQFFGTLVDAYRVCLWSRLANRVLLLLTTLDALNADMLYRNVKQISWSEHICADGSFVIDAHGTNEKLIHTQFTAQKIKDAIVDQFREKYLERPNVDKQDPDVRINVWVRRETAVVSIDLSGESLHKRGYRTLTGVAPLKENLAAALLYRCQWPTVFNEPDIAFVDPLCGSGTLVIEALLMAANIAPGLQRSFGFERWLQHDAAAWQQLKQEAEQKRQVGLAQVLPKFIGYDTSADAIALAQQAANQLGIESYLEFEQQDIAQLENVTHCNKGLLLTNPPYGNRLNAHEDLVPLYQTIAQHARENFMAWRLGIFTGSPDFCSKIGIRPYKKYRFLNGDLPCQLLLYEVIPEYFSSTSDFRLS